MQYRYFIHPTFFFFRFGSTTMKNHSFHVGISKVNKFCIFIYNITDQQALLSLKASVIADLDSWNNFVHFCHWTGVTCRLQPQTTEGYGTKTLLQTVRDTFSPHFKNLTFFRGIVLYQNNFRAQSQMKLVDCFEVDFLTI